MNINEKQVVIKKLEPFGFKNCNISSLTFIDGIVELLSKDSLPKQDKPRPENLLLKHPGHIAPRDIGANYRRERAEYLSFWLGSSPMNLSATTYEALIDYCISKADGEGR